MHYFITAVPDDVGSSRLLTLGYLTSLDRAKLIIEHNACRISSGGKYTFCVIECFPEGLFPDADAEWWFRWDGDKYIECAKPKRLRQLTNFGIGNTSR